MDMPHAVLELHTATQFRVIVRGSQVCEPNDPGILRVLVHALAEELNLLHAGRTIAIIQQVDLPPAVLLLDRLGLGAIHTVAGVAANAELLSLKVRLEALPLGARSRVLRRQGEFDEHWPVRGEVLILYHADDLPRQAVRIEGLAGVLWHMEKLDTFGAHLDLRAGLDLLCAQARPHRRRYGLAAPPPAPRSGGGGRSRHAGSAPEQHRWRLPGSSGPPASSPTEAAHTGAARSGSACNRMWRRFQMDLPKLRLHPLFSAPFDSS
mmetsp:Transcript_92004/g.269159  ORF Transcript_92004/g.269159 Transcript_92004/m.269159 type:complete len:265 (+) Transcript_92004:379-1173(+)